MKYDFDKKINRKNTNCIKWDSVEEGVLPFGIADMDFELAPVIQEALIKRIEHGVFGYSLEDQELVDTLVDWYNTTYHQEAKKEWFVLIPGIVPAFHVCANMAKSGVMSITPNYNMLLEAIEEEKKELITTKMINQDEHYSLDVEAMEEAWHEGIDQFMFCNPHNPLGKVYTKQELQELSTFCKKHDMIIVSDEIHCEIIYEGQHTTMLDVDDYARDHSIILMAPGKTYNMAGLPFAFAIIKNDELREKFKHTIFMSEPVLLSKVAAKAAYQKGQDWKEQVIDYLRGNRDYVEERLKTLFPKARYPHLQATYLMWIDLTDYFDEPAKWILEHAKVSFTDGDHYQGKGYVRVNIATSRQNIKEAFDRIEEAYKKTHR